VGATPGAGIGAGAAVATGAGPTVTPTPGGSPRGASCQCPCSGDQTFPAGGVPGGAGFGSPDGAAELIGSLPGAGASCQWPCSGDQTCPGRPPLLPALPPPRANPMTTAVAPPTTSTPRRTVVSRPERVGFVASLPSWHFLYFKPLPQGHGSLRETRSAVTASSYRQAGAGKLPS
jgi:hypothetical protein